MRGYAIFGRSTASIPQPTRLPAILHRAPTPQSVCPYQLAQAQVRPTLACLAKSCPAPPRPIPSPSPPSQCSLLLIDTPFLAAFLAAMNDMHFRRRKSILSSLDREEIGHSCENSAKTGGGCWRECGSCILRKTAKTLASLTHAHLKHSWTPYFWIAYVSFFGAYYLKAVSVEMIDREL